MSSTIDKNGKSYSNGKIYQVLNRINDRVYVGSTCQTLCKRMVDHRKHSVAHDGLIYEEMRRLDKDHFYIELIETYPCESKAQLVSREQFYIRERGTLNKRATTDGTEHTDVKSDVIQLKALVHELYAKIRQIEDKINTLFNNVYSSGASTPTSSDEEEQNNTDTANKEDYGMETVINRKEDYGMETVRNRKEDYEPTQPSPPSPPSSPATPQVFQISDDEDIEVVIPHQITNYDLTEKYWEAWKEMLPGKLYEELEKLTLVKAKAEEECIHHPNDVSRFLNLESLKRNYEALTQEAIECWTSHLRSNYTYTEVRFDILKDKIPNYLLDKIKSLDARMHDKSDPEYGAESLSQGPEIVWTINTLIEEAYNFYVLYRDKNPSDESNATCQDLFEEWGCLPSSDSESGSDYEDKQKKKKKNNNKSKNKK